MNTVPFSLPDGSSVNVPFGMTFEAAEEYAKRLRPDAYKDSTPKKEGFVANLKSGYRDLMANNALGIGALGNEEQARAESRAARAKNDDTRAVSWEDVKNAEGIGGTLSAAGGFVRDSLAQTAPYMAQTMVGAKAGSMAGAPLGPVGSAIGAGVGGIAANLPAMFGSNLARQDAENPNAPLDKGSAAVAAVGQSALDATSTLFLFGRLAGVNKLAGEALPSLFKKPAAEVEKNLVKAAEQSLLKTTAKGAAQGAAVEMPTELAQTVLERAQAGLSLTGAEANKEYEATLAGAAAVGGALGPVRSVTERGAARKELAAKDKVAADEARALAASQEEEKKKVEEAKRQTPEYLVDLEQRYTAAQDKLRQMRADALAMGKPEQDSAEALQKKQLRDAIREYSKSIAPLTEEYTSRKADIAKSKLSPEEHMWSQMQTRPYEAPTYEYGEKTEKVDPEKQATQKQLDALMFGLNNVTSITGEAPTAADITSKLTPALVAAAQKHGLGIPGVDAATSKLLFKDVLQTEAKRQKADIATTMQQRAADLATQATNATQETDPLRMLKESMEQQDEFQNTGEHNYEYLDGIFERAVGEGNRRGERVVAIPDGVRPVHNAVDVLSTVDALFSDKDKADKDIAQAATLRNNESLADAVSRRERTNTSLTSLTTTSPIAGNIVEARRKQETALADIEALAEDLHANRTLGSPNPDARGSASSTRETLQNQIDKARRDFVGSVINEAAVVRGAFGKKLTEREAIRIGASINKAFREWLTRAAAEPRSAVEEDVIVEPAQMRGTKVVKGAKIEKVDPRPLAERKLGAYRAATELFKDDVRAAVQEVLSVRDTATRVEQPLKTQFADSEAAKVAEARGETAKTRGGELRRRREYVSDQLERALARGAIPPVQRAMQAAKEAIDAGQGSTDVVSGIENQRFTAGLLDSANELAQRVLNRQLERSQLDKLVREIEENTGRRVTNTIVKEDGNISRPRKGITISTGERLFGDRQPKTITKGTIPGYGEASGTEDLVDEKGNVVGNRSWDQGDLFDPAPLEKQQAEAKERIEKLTAQIADLKAGRFQSLKEGVSAAKRISGLEKAVAILQGYKKDGVDQDVRALRKEQTRLQSDLGFFRATAANFNKAPEVRDARKAFATVAEIKQQWARIEKESEQEREALKRRLDDINARLSDFDWVKDARGTGEDLVVSGPYSTDRPLPPVTGLVLDEARVAEKSALEKARKEAAGAIAAPVRGPKNAFEIAQDKIGNQLRTVRAAYQEAVLRSLANLKAAAFTPALQAKQAEAEAAITGAFTWLRDLKEQLTAAQAEFDKKSELHKRRIAFEKDTPAANSTERALTPLIKSINAEAKAKADELSARIALEQERIDRAAAELADIRDKIRTSWDGAKVNVDAATDAATRVEKLNLDYYAQQLREQGYIVDVDKGTVTLPNKESAVEQQAELRRQKEALARAETKQTDYAAEAVALRPQQQRLGLPGKRMVALTPKERQNVEAETARRDAEITNRAEASTSIAAAQDRALARSGLPGKTEEIKSITELDEDRRIAQEAEAKQRAKDSAERKKTNDAERAEIQKRIDIIQKTLDERRAEAAAATSKRARKPIETSIKQLMEHLASEKLALDNVGKRRVFRQQPVVVPTNNAPVTMRAGTPESRATTLAARASNTKKRTAKEETALQKALEKQRERDLAPVEYDDDIGISGFGTDDRFFSPEQQLPPLTTAQMREAKSHPLASKTHAEAAAWLLNQTTDPFKRAFIGRVLDAFRAGEGTVEFSTEFEDQGPGIYDASGNRVVLSPRLLGDEDALAYNLLHELTHAATVRGLSIDPALTKQVDALIKKVSAWTETREGKQYLADNPVLLDNGKLYGLKNAYEFVAETYARPEFQSMLKAIPTEENKSVWSRFVSAVARLFGAKTLKELGLLADAISIGERAMLSNWIANEIHDTNFTGVHFAPKRKYESAALGEAVATMIGGRNAEPLQEIREAATGLALRTRFVDNYAGIKEALKRGDATKAIQVVYDLMNFAQRNHFVQQAVTVGAPTRSWWAKQNGKDVYKTEAQEGASLKRVSELLGKVKGYGNAQAASDAFTLLAIAKRAQTEGWDRVFSDSSKDSDAVKARKQAARVEADKLAAEYDADPFKSPFADAYKEYQDWNRGMLQFATQAGVIKEEEFRRLAGKQNYTPLFRADDHGNLVLEIDQGRDITVGRLADEPHMVKLLGGSGQVMDFFTASVRNASVLIDASLHNIASREAAFALQAMGAAHPVAASEKGENIVEFRKNGDLQRFAVDTTDTDAADIPTELLVKGFAGVPASLPGFVRLMGVPAQILRKTVTRNPLYMMRQLVRDPLSAWLTTGAKFSPVSDTLKEVSKSFAGKQDKTLERRGITGGTIYADNDTDLERIQDEARNSEGWSWGYFMSRLDHAAHAADAITRRNVYAGAIKQGASEIEATLAAYESMPFSKRGTSPSARYLNHMVPFLSAAIQGWNVLYNAAKGDMPLADRVNVRNKLLSRGMMIAGMSMLYALANEDDEKYKNANTSERLNNWFVKLPGTDETIKLPVPFELGIIFKMIPEALVRIAVSDKDAGQELRDVGGAMANMVPNLMVPQAMLPAVEALLNKSFFTGNSIEGRSLQNIDIGQRYDKNTSELSKLVGFDVELFGKQIGISPKMLEYVMGQYTAGIYPALAAIIDTVLPSPISEKPDRTLAEMPLFRSALLQEDAGGEVNRLYDKIEKFTRFQDTFKQLAKTDLGKAQEYAKENMGNLGKGAAAAKMKATIDKISNAENVVRNNSALTSTQKKEALDNFKRIKATLASQYGAALS